MAMVVMGVTHSAAPIPHRPNPISTRIGLRCPLAINVSIPSINAPSPTRIGIRAPIRPTKRPTSGETMVTPALNGRIMNPVTSAE